MTQRVIGLFLILFFAASPARAGDAEARIQAAMDAANSWLALVDEGKYDQSWSESASFFRSKVTQEDWKKQIQAARAMVGKFGSRKTKGSQAFTSLPGAPDGKYVVIQYDASFEKKKDAVETVTPTLDKDGKWHVSGYFIK